MDGMMEDTDSLKSQLNSLTSLTDEAVRKILKYVLPEEFISAIEVSGGLESRFCGSFLPNAPEYLKQAIFVQDSGSAEGVVKGKGALRSLPKKTAGILSQNEIDNLLSAIGGTLPAPGKSVAEETKAQKEEKEYQQAKIEAASRFLERVSKFRSSEESGILSPSSGSMERILTGAVSKSILDLAETAIVDLFKIAGGMVVRQGVMSMSFMRDAAADPVLKKGIELIVDQANDKQIRDILCPMIEAILVESRTKTEIITEGIMGIEHGEKTESLEDKLRTRIQGSTAPESTSLEDIMGKRFLELTPAEIIELVIRMSRIGRSRGVISLEKLVGCIKEPLVSDALVLVMDGTAPEVTRSIIQTGCDTFLNKLRNKYSMLMEGVRAIRQADGPDQIDLRVKAYV